MLTLMLSANTSGLFPIWKNYPQTTSRETSSILCSYSQYARPIERAIVANSQKGYNLKVQDMWQGKYSEYIKVIGGKSSGKQRTPFLQDTAKFEKNYKLLKERLSIPIRVIQALRNPFDMIATGAVAKNLKSDPVSSQKLFAKLKHIIGGSVQENNDSTAMR